MKPEMPNARSKRDSAARVARHRVRAAASGVQRLEVSVPRADASLVRAVARTLRDGGEEAAVLRTSLSEVAAPGVARTGAELLAFLRSGPLFDVDLDIRRDDFGRPPVEFE